MRPEDWENPYWANEKSESAFEAGADAMLEGLVKQGRYVTPNTYIDYPQLIASIGAQNRRGYIVFIEE